VRIHTVIRTIDVQCKSINDKTTRETGSKKMNSKVFELNKLLS
jgi:hypothetical protein